jgi:hypothetical protein
VKTKSSSLLCEGAMICGLRVNLFYTRVFLIVQQWFSVSSLSANAAQKSSSNRKPSLRLR